MSRLQTRYVCEECGAESVKWLGRCPACETWDSLVEEPVRRVEGARARSEGSRPVTGGAPAPITDVQPECDTRISSGIPELDRVLGGGIVAGGVTLVGGDPGIGKSTLLTQAAYHLAKGEAARRGLVLYVSGEESPSQIKLRCARLGAESPGLLLCAETDVERILQHLDSAHPCFAVIDSIQTVTDGGLDSAAGTVSQVRACATRLAQFARSSIVPMALIGHVTKEGSLAGPRVLEHIVDTVLYFEGDRHHAYRILRAAKNRFGSTDELGIFEMSETGLQGVQDPSAALLAERLDGRGSAIACSLEGSRAILSEVQALTTRSYLAGPRRTVTGLDAGRVDMLLAVLEKRAGIRLGDQDVFVNVAGGIRIVEPAADLAVAAAVASSFTDRPVDPQAVLIGEIGLGGEVRAVSQIDKRLREAARQGFRRAIIATSNASTSPRVSGMRDTAVKTVVDAIGAALTKPRQ